MREIMKGAVREADGEERSWVSRIRSFVKVSSRAEKDAGNDREAAVRGAEVLWRAMDSNRMGPR